MASFNINLRVSLDVLGQSLNTLVQDASAVVVNNLTVLPAQVATLAVRTNNTDGTLTMANTAHGIVTGQRLDLYWSNGKRYYVIAGTVSGVTVPFTSASGGGDNLPVITTPISVGIPNSISFVAPTITAIFLGMPKGWNGFFTFDAAGTVDIAHQYVTGGTPYYSADAGILTGIHPTKLWVSTDSTTLSVQPQAGVLTH